MAVRKILPKMPAPRSEGLATPSLLTKTATMKYPAASGGVLLMSLTVIPCLTQPVPHLIWGNPVCFLDTGFVVITNPQQAARNQPHKDSSIRKFGLQRLAFLQRRNLSLSAETEFSGDCSEAVRTELYFAESMSIR
jgi:hypothetical protein